MEILKTNVFDETIKQGSVIVDFFAEWCGPCKMITPVLEQLATEYEGKTRIYKVNVDNDPDLTARYGITSIPHILAFKDGQLVNKAIGYQTKDQLIKLIESTL